MRSIVAVAIIILLDTFTLIMNRKEKAPMNINIRFQLLSADQVLDPAILLYTSEYIYLQNLSLNLFEVDSKGNYRSQLAKEMKYDEVNSEYKITIRDAFFSNGEMITSTDVAKSIKRAILLGTPHFDAKDLFLEGHSLKSVDDEIKGVEVIDDKELVLRIGHSSKELFYYLQLTDLGILHSSQYTKEKLTVADWEEVTSGPYRVSFEDGTITLVANPDALNYSPDMPQKVKAIRVTDDDSLLDKLKDKTIDLGIMTPLSYFKMKEQIDAIDNFDLFGDRHDNITVLALNIKNEKFSKVETRRWLLKKVMDYYSIPDNTKDLAEKSYQFFLPKAKGYVANHQIDDLLSDVSLDVIPVELENGIVIKTVTGMNGYLLPELEADLTKVLGIDVKIEANLDRDRYVNTIKERNYDALIIAISMSYKVLGEMLNFQYLNENSIFQDPEGKVKSLLAEYQNLEDENDEYQVIEKIMKQMTRDAECIPLYYLGSPTFFQSDKLDISDLYLDEAIQFWRIRVKP